jgi:glutathione S-transferase
MIGVHARRLYYSEALVEHPLTVLPIIADYLDEAEAKLVRGIWQFIATTMIELMDLGGEQGLESRGIVIQQLDWFDTLLDDGRDYLIGDTLTRVDISVASLLAPLVNAPEHPTYANLQVPPRLALDLAEWQSRPISQFVTRMYKRHR